MRIGKGFLFRAAALLFCLGFLGAAVLLGINAHVKGRTAERILSPAEAAALSDVDCVLVLGCFVQENGVPSDMLADRLRRGVELYENGAAPKLLMSGDHGRSDYDEVAAMKQYAVDAGVASENVFMDHAGFSTYESLYRARDVFAVKRLIIVTQKYHLYRALYIAEELGLEACGVASDYHSYRGQSYRDIREILARNKDFIGCIFQPEPTFLGDVIPISGSGLLTHDANSDFA